MNTFKNLEQLNVSEKCFKEITNVISTLLEEWEITLDDLIKYDKENPPKSYEDTMKEWNKEYKKNTTKNQRGEFNTKKKQFPKSYKELGNAYGEPDKAEVEAERAERRSIARHKKKTGIIECFENLNISEECFGDILNIVEEYINEVTRGNRFQRALNSISPRNITLNQVRATGNPEEIQNAQRRVNQAQNIIDSEGEGGRITREVARKTRPDGTIEAKKRVKTTPLNREEAKNQDDYRAGNMISWSEHENRINRARRANASQSQ